MTTYPSNLHRNISSEVYRQSQSCIRLFDQVTKLFGALEFLFLEPFFNKLLSLLNENWSTKFKRFMPVELTLKDTKRKFNFSVKIKATI